MSKIHAKNNPVAANNVSDCVLPMFSNLLSLCINGYKSHCVRPNGFTVAALAV